MYFAGKPPSALQKREKESRKEGRKENKGEIGNLCPEKRGVRLLLIFERLPHFGTNPRGLHEETKAHSHHRTSKNRHTSKKS